MHRLLTVAVAASFGLLALGATTPAQAAAPDQVWLTGVSGGINGGNPTNTLTFDDGSTATQTLTANSGTQCLPGGQQASPVGETNPYYTPSVPPGTVFETIGCTGGSSFTTTITFSKAVTNPRLHIVNLDGSSVNIGGTSTTGAQIVPQKDSGNNALVVSGNTLNPSPIGVGYGGCQANTGEHQYGQCGTIVLSTSSGAIKSFTLSNLSVVGNDGWAIAYSFPLPPTADDDTATTTADTPTTINPVSNDDAGGAALEPGSVRLLDGDTPVTSLTTSEGTYAVDTTTGEITFTPATGYTGTTTPVTYQVSDSDGSVATAIITVTVAPAAGSPMANPGVLGLILVLGLAGGGLWLRRRSVAV